MTAEQKKEFTRKITQANSAQLIVILYDIALVYVNDAISFMEKYPDIKLITVSPYKSFGDDRKNADYWEYRNTLDKSSEVIYISDEYFKGCMSKRNLAMINMSDLLIAVVKEDRSGTSQTIRYAAKKGLKAHIINIGNAFEGIEEYTPVII